MTSARDVSQILSELLKCEACGIGPSIGKYRWYQHGHESVIISETVKNLSEIHYMCQDCIDAQQNVNVRCECNERMSKVHCRITEELLKLESMRFKCVHVSRGCQQSLSETAMKSHQEECAYRLVNCPLFNCVSKVPFHELHQHLDNSNHWLAEFSHRLRRYQCGRIWIELNFGFFEAPVLLQPCKIVYDDKVFVLNGFQRVKNETLYHWIQLIGSPNEAKNYSYSLCLKGNEPNVFNVFDRNLNSIDESSKEIVKSGKCFRIKFDTLKARFLNENRRYNFSISIRKLKN